MASKTYRERVEELNQYLGSVTEHHDIPRVRLLLQLPVCLHGEDGGNADTVVYIGADQVSAAGNG